MESRSSSPFKKSTSKRPLLKESTCSMESVRRFSIPFRTTRRSTKTSMVCRLFFSKSISSSSSYILPSILTRTKPERRTLSKSFSCFPFFPLTTGAKSCIFVPSSRFIRRSTISSTVCFLISLPHSGQWGIPTLA